MMRSNPTKFFNAALVLVLAGGLLGGCSKLKKAPAPNVGTVARGDVVQRVTASGYVEPNRKGNISAPYDGYIQKIFVKVGQKVKKDAPVVSFTESLSGGADQNYPLRAPFDGTVVQVLRTEGEYVAKSDTKSNVLRIDDLTRLFVDVNVPETDILKMKVGQAAVVRTSAGDSKSYKGIIRTIALAASVKDSYERARVEFLIRVEVLDFDDRIQPGMATIVDVVTEERKNVLTLRHEFIQKEGAQNYLKTPGGGRKDITLGLQNEEAAEIVTGASEGDQAEMVDFLKLNPDV